VQIGEHVVGLMAMDSSNLRVLVPMAACGILLAVALPHAAAAPASDGEGYLNSTARCAAPNTVVVFGSTDNSRIAICRMADGTFSYRGVRVSDGARLIVPAKESTDGTFVADNNGIEYLVTAKSLVVSAGNTVIREEPMVDFHGPQAPPAPGPAAPTSTTPLPPPLPAERSDGTG
jgi:hypothetical protein